MTDTYLTEEDKAFYASRTVTLPAAKPEAPAPVDRPKTPRAGGLAGVKGVNSNSHAAYNSIKKELGPKQQEVLDTIRKAKRPICDQEIAKHLGWTINRVTARRYEIEVMGKIERAFKAVYPVTGRPVDYWRAAEAQA